MARWIGTWAGGRIRAGRHGSVWVIERRVAGARRTIPLAASTEREAMAELALFLRDPSGYRVRTQTASAAQQSGAALTEAVVARYLAWMVGRRLSRRYVLSARTCLAWWADVLAGRPVSKLATAELLGALEGTPNGKGKLIALKAWTAWLRQTAQLAGREDPTLDMRVPQADPARVRAPKWSPLPEVAALYRRLPKQQVRDVIRVLAATGMHQTELARLCHGDGAVREIWDGGIAAVLDFPHKGGKVHRVSIDATTLSAVRRLRAPEGWVSASHVVRLCARVAKQARITPVPPGQLRHSFATWARQSGELVHPATRGLPIEAVAAALGHASISTTQRFYDQSDVPPLLLVRGLQLLHPDDPPVSIERRVEGAPDPVSEAAQKKSRAPC